jgi:hypothetical protein
MSSIQPSSLSDIELVKYAYIRLSSEPLPLQWQHELVKRLEELLYAEDAAKDDAK